MIYSIKRKQILRTNKDGLWDFISQPTNLRTITPPGLDFFVLSDVKDKKMYEGQIIEYYVRPFKGYTAHWVTEITHLREGEFFVDEQRFGPYRFWHHQHQLKTTLTGVEMTDIVHYKLPFGWLGRLAHFVLIKKKLKHIFDYREHKLNELFDKLNDSDKSRNTVH